MGNPDRDVFYPIIGQTKWKRLKKSLLVWDPVTRVVKKASNIPRWAGTSPFSGTTTTSTGQ